MQKLELNEASPRFDQEEKDQIKQKLLCIATGLLFAAEHDCDSSVGSVFSSDWDYLENFVSCAMHKLEKLSKLADSKRRSLHAKTGS